VAVGQGTERGVQDAEHRAQNPVALPREQGKATARGLGGRGPGKTTFRWGGLRADSAPANHFIQAD